MIGWERGAGSKRSADALIRSHLRRHPCAALLIVSIDINNIPEEPLLAEGELWRNRQTSMSELRLKDLSPGYFALVMATGIVSIAAGDFGLVVFATGLFAFNIAAYVVLACLTAARLILYRREFFADITDHGRGPGCLAVVAGTCILGTQAALPRAAAASRLCDGTSCVDAGVYRSGLKSRAQACAFRRVAPNRGAHRGA